MADEYNPRQQLLGKREPEKDDKKTPRGLKIEFTEKGIGWSLIHPEDASNDEMDKAANKVIDFLIKKFIPFGIKALADLGAKDEIIKMALKEYIDDASNILVLDKEDRDNILR